MFISEPGRMLRSRKVDHTVQFMFLRFVCVFYVLHRLCFSMSLHDDNVERRPSVLSQNNNNQEGLLKPQPQTDIMRKSPVQIALEQEEQPEPSLYKGGNIQSKSFKILEQELVDGERRASATPEYHSEDLSLLYNFCLYDYIFAGFETMLSIIGLVEWFGLVCVLKCYNLVVSYGTLL